MDYKDLSGLTLLGYAVKMGDASLVKRCIELGASVVGNKNLVSEALKQGSSDIAHYLHLKGASCENTKLSDCTNTQDLDWLFSLKKHSLFINK